MTDVAITDCLIFINFSTNGGAVQPVRRRRRLFYSFFEAAAVTLSSPLIGWGMFTRGKHLSLKKILWIDILAEVPANYCRHQLLILILAPLTDKSKKEANLLKPKKRLTS